MMETNEELRLRDVGFDNPGMHVTMQLVYGAPGEQRCIGTAFSVAPGLAITAAHVVEEYREREDRSKGDPAPPLAAIQIFDGKVLQWLVDAIYGSVVSDIAFLRFLRPDWWGDGPGQLNPRCARLNFNPPALGDELHMFGFPQSELKDGILYVSPLECRCHVSRVDLKTELPEGFRPLSHIDVEGHLLPGMSGGPCFDTEWNVVGVNSKGWDGQQLAHVALIWPAMKIPIDLFRSGEFPAIDLFKEGPARAIGYGRLYVTSKGEARLARIDPDSLVPLKHLGLTEHLPGALNFAGSNAQDSLVQIRASIEKTAGGIESLDTNQILRCVRNYFWELETALGLSLLLAARQAHLAVPEPPSWEQLVMEWKKKSNAPEIIDELEALAFDWHGIDLFEVRTYAELSRTGVIPLSSSVSVPTGQVFGVFLPLPCRKGGQQIFLPDGLDRFMESSRRFVQRLLRLSLMEGERSD